MGAIGGLLGQLIFIFNAIHRKWKKEVDILNPKVVQNFLFLYIDSKMKTEKFVLQVGKGVEDFLVNLPQPLQLNEMRVMKEANAAKFRALLSDPEQYGDEILRLIRVNMNYLNISRKAYDAVYEGFWDIYCKKPQSPDLNPKKIEGFVPRVKLTVPPQEQPPAEEGG